MTLGIKNRVRGKVKMILKLIHNIILQCYNENCSCRVATIFSCYQDEYLSLSIQMGPEKNMHTFCFHGIKDQLHAKASLFKN